MTEALTKEHKPMRWNDGSIVHECEGDWVHPGIYLVWTKCKRDVPENSAHYGRDQVTCERCVHAE